MVAGRWVMGEVDHMFDILGQLTLEMVGTSQHHVTQSELPILSSPA